jgi:alkaline phosphatase
MSRHTPRLDTPKKRADMTPDEIREMMKFTSAMGNAMGDVLEKLNVRLDATLLVWSADHGHSATTIPLGDVLARLPDLIERASTTFVDHPDRRRARTSAAPANDTTPTFHCPRWPGCGCPDGTVAMDCPGLDARRKGMV